MSIPSFAQRTSRYSAKKVAIPVNFMLVAPEAQAVTVVGDFNKWDPGAHPLSRRPDGSWQAQVVVTSGHHCYQFLVDGVPTLDPRGQGVTRNERNERASLLSVS